MHCAVHVHTDALCLEPGLVQYHSARLQTASLLYTVGAVASRPVFGLNAGKYHETKTKTKSGVKMNAGIMAQRENVENNIL